MAQSRDWPYDENYRLKSGLPNEDSSIFDNVDSFNPDESNVSERKDSKIEIDICIPLESVAAANFTKYVENNQTVVDSNLNQELSDAVSNTVGDIFNEEILDLSEIKHSEGQQGTLRPFTKAVIKQSVKIEEDDQRTLKVLSPECSNDQGSNFVPQEISCLSDEETLETDKQSNANKVNEEKSAFIKREKNEQRSGKGTDPRKFGMERSRKDASVKGESSKQQGRAPQKVAKNPFNSSPRRASVGNYNRHSPRKRLGAVDEATPSSTASRRRSDAQKSVPKQRSSNSPQKRTMVQSSRAQPSSVRPVKSTPPGSSKASGKPRAPKTKHPSSAVPAMKTSKQTAQTGTSGSQTGTPGSRKIPSGVQQKQQRGTKPVTSFPSTKGQLNRQRTSKECPPNDKRIEEHGKNSGSQMLRRQSPIDWKMDSPTAKKPNETSVSEQKQQSPRRTLEIIPAESKEGKLDHLTASLSQTSFSSLGSLYGSSASTRNSDLMLKLTSSEESLHKETTHVIGVLRNVLKIPFLLQLYLCFVALQIDGSCITTLLSVFIVCYCTNTCCCFFTILKVLFHFRRKTVGMTTTMKMILK